MYNYFSLSSAVVKIDEDNLLPRSQGQLPLNDGDGERGFHQGCSDMRETITITPAPVMFVRDIGRDDLFYRLLQIFEHTRFIFNGSDPTS